MKAVSIAATLTLAFAAPQTFTVQNNCTTVTGTVDVTGTTLTGAASAANPNCLAPISSDSVTSSSTSANVTVTDSATDTTTTTEETTTVEQQGLRVLTASAPSAAVTGASRLTKRQNSAITFVFGNGPCASATTAGGSAQITAPNPFSVSFATLCTAPGSSVQSIQVNQPGATSVCTNLAVAIPCPAVSSSSAVVTATTTVTAPVNVNVNVTVNVVVSNDCATCGTVTRYYNSPINCFQSVIYAGVCYYCPQNQPVLVASPVVLCPLCTATIAVASVSTAPITVQTAAQTQPARPVIQQGKGSKNGMAAAAIIAGAAALL